MALFSVQDELHHLLGILVGLLLSNVLALSTQVTLADDEDVLYARKVAA